MAIESIRKLCCRIQSSRVWQEQHPSYLPASHLTAISFEVLTLFFNPCRHVSQPTISSEHVVHAFLPFKSDFRWFICFKSLLYVLIKVPLFLIHPRYLAVGLSDDGRMGDDLTSACVVNPNTGDVDVVSGFNSGYRLVLWAFKWMQCTTTLDSVDSEEFEYI